MAGSPQRVLVVDDDRSLRLLCRVNLELEGFAVTEASTLAEARAALGDGGVDVVLLDVHVGSESGLVLLDELDAAAGAPPVALLTGESGVPRAVRERAAAVVSKPFEIGELTGTVERLAALR